MRWRQVVLLWAAAVLLGIEYLRLAPVRPTPEAPERVRSRLFAIEPAALAEVVIERGGRRVVLRHQGGSWAVTDPVAANVPSDLVRAFVTALLEAEEIERVAGPDGHERFGLDDRASRIELRPLAGERDVLLLGGTNPTGTAVYARRAGAPDVLLVGRTLLYYEDMILQALPMPSVPAGTEASPIGLRSPLTPAGRAG